MIELIQQEKPKIPNWFLFKYFAISSSNFYRWKERSKASSFTKKNDILSAIKSSFDMSKGTYGSPRVYQDLKKQGVIVGENTVAKYMKELGLDARLKKKYKVQTTDSKHSHPIAERVFKAENKEALPSEPGKVLAGDITYLRLGDGHIYLAVVIDLFNREIVGWSMGLTLETKLILDALSSAMYVVGPDAKVIFHSDRGSQYASDAFRKYLKNYNFVPSMSRKGNCYDNCYVESWFSSLKKEWLYRQNYNTEAELRALVFEYIEVWYNKKRQHSSLGFLSPVEYKQINKIGS